MDKESIRKRHPVGSEVLGIVTSHHAFGLFFKVPLSEAHGCILITCMNTDKPIKPRDFPEINSKIVCSVLDNSLRDDVLYCELDKRFWENNSDRNYN